MPPRRRRAAAGAQPSAAAAIQTSIEDLPDPLLSTIFSLAGLLPLVGPAINATCTRFRRALLSDPERWCILELGPAPLHLSAAKREDWLAAKLGLLHQVGGLVESLSVVGVAQMLDWSRPCPGRWTLERFLARLDAHTLTGLSLEDIPGRQALLTAVARFQHLTSLDLGSSTTPLPKNTAAVVGALAELRFLSLYSWGGSAVGRDAKPRLTRLPDGVVTEALPRLSRLTYLQLGGLHGPTAAQLTCLAPTLRLLSLFDQEAPSGGLPSPPVKADWPLLASYSADWEFSGGYRGKQVGGNLLKTAGCTLTYGAATSATGRAVDVTAEATLERSHYDAGTLQSALNQLLPAGAALTQLTLLRHTSNTLAAPALSELQALNLQDCEPTCLGPLVACALHLSSLSFAHAPWLWRPVGSRIAVLPAAMAALPLRRAQLQGVNLGDLPPGRWLEDLEELEVSKVRCLRAALAGTPIRRLTLEIGSYAQGQAAQPQQPTTADVDNSLLLMPHLERLALRGAVPQQVFWHVLEQAPHIHLA